MSIVLLEFAERPDTEVAQVPQQQISFAEAFDPLQGEALVGASLLADLEASESLAEQVERSVYLQSRDSPRSVSGPPEAFAQMLRKSDRSAVLNYDAAEAELAFARLQPRLLRDGLAEQALEEIASLSVNPLVYGLLGHACGGEGAREESDYSQRRRGYFRRLEYGRAELQGGDLAALPSHPAAGFGERGEVEARQ